MFWVFKCLNIAFVKFVLVSATFHTINQNKEYCQWETFEAKCSRNEVILIEEARYGRMNIGKCITQKEITGLGNLGHDQQYFGCFKDVTDILHKKCSLKNECQVSIPNADLDITNPCFSVLKSYLTASYKCVDAVESEGNCRIIVSQRPKYIVSSNRGQCGSTGQPWIVEVSRGQNIKTVISVLNKTDRIDSNMKCDSVIGNIREIDRNTKRNVSICSDGFLLSKEPSGRYHKYRELLSRSSLLELVLIKTSPEKLDFNSMYLIGLEAYGCIDIIPPEDAWLKRNGDDIVIGCYSSKQTWYLRCEDGKWSGSIGNCSLKINAVDITDILTTKGYRSEISEEQQIILFVSICALGVVICLIIVCFGAICIKRYSSNYGAKSIYNKQPIYYPNTQCSINPQALSDDQQKSLNKFVNNESFHENLENGQLMQEKSEENKYFVLEDDMFTN